MLRLRRHPQLDFPHSVRNQVQHKFAFAPVLDETDELIEQINHPSDEVWELADQPNEELDLFWDKVVDDVRHDPEWQFTNDDE